MTTQVDTGHLAVAAGTEQWTFRPGDVVRIGRSPGCDIVIDDPAVSRDHLRVEFDDGWVVRDRSAAGTTCDGRPVTELRVAGRVVLRLAGAVEVVLSAGQARTAAVSIGRGAGNDVVLDDPMVSRRQAVARRVPGGWTLTELGGRNPTLHNGNPVRGEIFVADGDRVTFGSTEVAITALGFTPLPSSGRRLLVEEVSVRAPDGKTLLSGVDLAVAAGELIAVVGPSGAGKSTLLKVMAGQLEPADGQVTFEGADVHADGTVRTRIGVVPQDDILHTRLTAQAALSYSASLRLPSDTSRAERRELVAAALDEVDLAAHAGTRVRRLSGGQRKRVSIAMELLTSPPVLLLDEPTSGLDPNLDRQIMASLRRIADAGRSVVVVTHNTANLDRCDRVLVLAPGGVPCFLGPPDGLAPWFGTTDWAEIFEAIQNVPPMPLPPQAPSGLQSTGSAPVPAPARRSWRQQARTLTARHAALLAADPGYSAFLLLAPVIVAVLALVVPGAAGLGPPLPDDPGESGQILVLMVVGAAFTGAASGVREVVAERAIFLRERAAGLRPLAYAASKLIVLGGVAAVQAAVLTVGVRLLKAGPAEAVLLGDPWLEIAAALWLTAFSTCAFALFASAAIRSVQQAMPVLVVIVMAQLVLCGGMVPVADRVVLDQVSWLAPARWGYAAAAGTADLARFVPGASDDVLWRHSPSWWSLAASVMVAMTALSTLLLVRRLTRMRP
ncbi:ATP-binding cassette domain-containing protein [Actinokineospora sp. UTMC 2448]|uniref:ATP-binding cassette domain-containing protein n=1 Tax=Actinokineospora sp. UTMC 2448 TaxID=2268449 RepID=UPI002164CA25|nr:ATP-binding cassette domain-containing protein [Actinokineospora sp. UTMC 2448]UVS79460.1 ABC transporter ATP-binding/permease protein [Actinokineospora sp. UTMC 2448]